MPERLQKFDIVVDNVKRPFAALGVQFVAQLVDLGLKVEPDPVVHAVDSIGIFNRKPEPSALAKAITNAY